MKSNKFPVILIIILVMVLIAIILFGINFLGGKVQEKDNSKSDNVELIVPILELNLNTTEENQESVTIEVNASTEDSEGIDHILLPDGSTFYGTYQEYIVKENGKYEFKAFGKNGTSSRLSIDVKNIMTVSAKNPYIPDGFEHVFGEVDEGFVIQDRYGNQYVWIPVETGILTRTTLTNGEYEDSNYTATGLVNSVAKNFGFYIARFEASAFQANQVRFAGSVEGQIPWTNVSYQDATNAAVNTAIALQYPEEYVTAISSSYAWDTALSWIDQTIINYSTNTSYGNYSGTIFPTGGTESDRVKNICDLSGNVREWTTEIYKDANSDIDFSDIEATEYVNRVVRGGSAYINKVASSRNGYPENLTDEYWGFRIILYKSN
ncbi:MAG: SUMF1/EgtB/PvdO family nonheme iron enzyme [Clostridia bacterium]|nr:SUMF1/EgtB/PvdO family nonheme iron enzyme [Clostridia bacterium]